MMRAGHGGHLVYLFPVAMAAVPAGAGYSRCGYRIGRLIFAGRGIVVGNKARRCIAKITVLGNDSVSEAMDVVAVGVIDKDMPVVSRGQIGSVVMRDLRRIADDVRPSVRVLCMASQTIKTHQGCPGFCMADCTFGRSRRIRGCIEFHGRSVLAVVHGVTVAALSGYRCHAD